MANMTLWISYCHHCRHKSSGNTIVMPHRTMKQFIGFVCLCWGLNLRLCVLGKSSTMELCLGLWSISVELSQSACTAPLPPPPPWVLLGQHTLVIYSCTVKPAWICDTKVWSSGILEQCYCIWGHWCPVPNHHSAIASLTETNSIQGGIKHVHRKFMLTEIFAFPHPWRSILFINCTFLLVKEFQLKYPQWMHIYL